MSKNMQNIHIVTWGYDLHCDAAGHHALIGIHVINDPRMRYSKCQAEGFRTVVAPDGPADPLLSPSAMNSNSQCKRYMGDAEDPIVACKVAPSMTQRIAH